ncbi:hypothetical protein [Luteibacter rhizovicinus]|nr:hypothetical protein [Luteibacter rhizovicinus]
MSESRSAPSALPVSLPFAVDTEGKSITIPFDVRQGEVDTKRRLMHRRQEYRSTLAT